MTQQLRMTGTLSLLSVNLFVYSFMILQHTVLGGNYNTQPLSGPEIPEQKERGAGCWSRPYATTPGVKYMPEFNDSTVLLAAI